MPAALLAGAAGCGAGDDPAAMLHDYVARVQRAAQIEVLDGAGYRPQLHRYPARRERRLALTDVRIGVLDFLALYDCGLQALIGERNSSLGKVMPVSQQLLYEHRLLLATERCRVQLAREAPDDTELRAQLDAVLHTKMRDLPRAYWNATFGSPEFEHMFSLAAAPLALSAAASAGREVEHALASLADLAPRLGQVELNLDSAGLERHYQTLQTRRMAGEVLGAIDLLRFYLDTAARALEQHLAEQPMCYRSRPSARARILDNVFHTFYAGRVQPYLARVHRQAAGWLEALARLAALQRAHMTPALAQYYELQLSMEHASALWPRYRAALQRHTRAWQELLHQCGLMPG